MNYREAEKIGITWLKEAGVPDPELDAWYLLEYCMQKRNEEFNKTWYLAHKRRVIPEDAAEEYGELLMLRAGRRPLQYITGEQEFMGYRFKVNENVLIPRQDTETLVEEAMEYAQMGMKVLDMCTGSGCILLSLMLKRAGLIGTAADISKEALEVAKENAKALSIDAKFVESDLFANVEGTFDLIVSNPPYIPTGVIGGLMKEVRDFEPIEALDGREDGLHFYRKIVEECGNYLNPGGKILFEIGYDQAEDVMKLLTEAGFTDVYKKKDLAGNDRVVGAKKA